MFGFIELLSHTTKVFTLEEYIKLYRFYTYLFNPILWELYKIYYKLKKNNFKAIFIYLHIFFNKK